MNYKRIFAILFWGSVILFFPAAILAYTFIPSLAPLMPLGSVIFVFFAFCWSVAILASSQEALIEEMHKQNADRLAKAASAEAEIEDELAGEFE